MFLNWKAKNSETFRPMVLSEHNRGKRSEAVFQGHEYFRFVISAYERPGISQRGVIIRTEIQEADAASRTIGDRPGPRYTA